MLRFPPCFPVRLVLITGLVLAVSLSPSAGHRSDGLPAPPQAAPVPALAYFPPPDRDGGWRTAATTEEARRAAGMDLRRLDEAYEIARQSTKNGGLLIVRNGWLVYERYFGLAGRESMPNLASIGKSFTSVAVGVLLAERPDRFPDGLDQKVFTPELMPSVAFPLADPAMADIKLGQLLAFTAGIRGNNPCFKRKTEMAIEPPGPDGWQAMVDEVSVGKRPIEINGILTSATPLWCAPGDGYSYATASAHLASMVVRKVSGMELESFIRARIAEPSGWGRFTYGYRHATDIKHTPGGGGIAARATDMVRFGYLLLRSGRWRERQILPAEHVQACSQISPYNPHFPYSLGFDVNGDGHVPDYPRDAFWKSGSGGHVLYIVPSRDLVVWKLGGRDSQYQPSDTGVPIEARDGQRPKPEAAWNAGIDQEIAQRQVLTKVLDSITE